MLNSCIWKARFFARQENGNHSTSSSIISWAFKRRCGCLFRFICQFRNTRWFSSAKVLCLSQNRRTQRRRLPHSWAGNASPRQPCTHPKRASYRLREARAGQASRNSRHRRERWKCRGVESAQQMRLKVQISIRLFLLCAVKSDFFQFVLHLQVMRIRKYRRARSTCPSLPSWYCRTLACTIGTRISRGS